MVYESGRPISVIALKRYTPIALRPSARLASAPERDTDTFLAGNSPGRERKQGDFRMTCVNGSLGS